MNKVLPMIEMPQNECVAIPDSGVESDKELIKELLNDSVDENISADIIDIDEREIPSEDEVFDDPPPPKVKQISEEELPQFSELPQQTKGKRKYTRKNPMSEKQKDHLARIRKIASEKKKVERELKEQRKEEEVERKLEEKILKKKREEQEKQNKPPTPPPYTRQDQRERQGFTQDDLDSAVLNAVSTYDTYRKQQKKEKKERLHKEEEDKKMRDTIQRAINPSQTTVDPWRSLFG